ncbi:MAG: UDP-glucose 4-epimerase GalE [Clostridia bacterium]|nr:UDP-glucose 4-epimerase GalE [Clostridia bacterium]
MRVLLTGGAGYIATHTCVELLNEGNDIVVADNLSNSSEEAVRRVKKLTGRDFPFYRLDVCDARALNDLFDSEKIDSVIHFAGLKAVGESVSKPIEYYTNNLYSTLTLIEAMRAHDVYKIVFSSSATVYSVNTTSEMTEDMNTGCINPYGWTKYMIEQILRDVAKTDERWSAILLRYFNPVGAHKSGMIGEDPNGIPNNLMPCVLQFASGRLENLTVYGDDYPTRDGTCVRDYIHVVDLAKGHVAALKYMDGFSGCDEINLGTGKGTSVLELINTFERVNGLKLDYKIGARRPGDSPACFANADKARRLLGWKAQLNIEDMCRDAWRWQTMNPNGYKKGSD